MTEGGHRTGRRPLTTGHLVLPVVLAAVAGYVDAIGFVWLFGVFPANQSGNVVLLGIAIGQSQPSAGWRAAVSLAGFAAGAAFGIAMAMRLGDRPHGRLLVAIELTLLVAMLAAGGPIDALAHPVPGVRGTLLLLLATVAMGVQTMALRRAAGVAVTTTYQSGAVAHVAEAATRWLLLPSARAGSGRTLVVVVITVIGYMGGAAGGAALGARWSWALALPCLVLATVLVLWTAEAERLVDTEGPNAA
jgi:uncharacterized membrane protein YoaK (UPF0700 family)